MIARSKLHWLTEVGMFFEKQGPVWDTLRELDRRLREASIEYTVIGGLALSAHQYPRQTIDVDIVLTAADFEKFRQVLEGSVYVRTEGASRRFRDPDSEVTIDILIAGELAGRRSKNPSVRFPDPSERQMHGEIPTVSLARLIELKLVTWRFKDWGDVVELIRRRDLDKSFAEKLDPIARTPYRECFDQAGDEEYEEPGNRSGDS